MRRVRLRSRRKFWPRLSARRESVPRDDLAQRRQALAHGRVCCAAAICAGKLRWPRSGSVGLASPVPARESAVPWSGEVRMKGRPERHVDAAVEAERLHRDQRLVVIHAEDDVEAASRLLVEDACRPEADLSTSSPWRCSSSIAGPMTDCSSSPIAPPSPACGLRPGDRDAAARAMPK